MADDHTRDELAQLRTLIESQRAEFAAYRARHERPHRRSPRLPRRFLPLALVALLLVLTPLSLLAASPFNDLTGGVHDTNIGLIYDAGITKGCVPNVGYCPTANVTREEMASFLARTAGLGTNPPVVNAKTAQTAASADTATTAGSATTAATAQNANALGGQPPSAYLPSSGDMTLRYPGSMALSPAGYAISQTLYGGASFSLPANTGAAFTVPLPRPTAQFGRTLAVKGLRVCYKASGAGIRIDQTLLSVSERGDAVQTLIDDQTDHTSVTNTCYDLPVATPQAIAGMNTLYLYVVNGSGATRTLSLDSLALTLTPLAAGAAEVPPTADPDAPARP